ncbi:fad binding domain protein [Colletotrichum incanum]|uniref:Fad binding domain protein n=1 Tax=Colletotrichum incanum TaxID=1573173 RepID=A0A167B4I9_COLIC|nr:fad binding domain protein [Colletotrichum incanum]
MLGATWGQEAIPEEIAAASKKLVEQVQPWREASPGAAAYLNEADINEPNLQQAYCGSTTIICTSSSKSTTLWGVLCATTAVGSEHWYIMDQIDYYLTQNGRLCPK